MQSRDQAQPTIERPRLKTRMKTPRFVIEFGKGSAKKTPKRKKRTEKRLFSTSMT